MPRARTTGWVGVALAAALTVSAACAPTKKGAAAPAHPAGGRLDRGGLEIQRRRLDVTRVHFSPEGAAWAAARVEPLIAGG